MEIVEALLCPLGVLVVWKECLSAPCQKQHLLFPREMLFAQLFGQRKKEIDFSL